MINIVMPQMGESLSEGTIVKWLKSAGDRVARDEPLFEISTDKVDTDVPSPAAGVLREILVGEGETVAVNTAVAVLDTDEAPADAPPGADSGHFRAAHAPELVAFRKEGAAPARPSAALSPARIAGDSNRSFSPAVLELARAGGLGLGALTTLRGTGKGGRVTKRDVETFLRSGGGAAAAPESGQASDAVPPDFVYRPEPEDRVVPMSPARRQIARHMSWSTRISPHVTAFAECDMSAVAACLEQRREEFAGRLGVPLTYTVLVARAAVAALSEHPALNASVVGDALVLKPRVHLGVAVALTDPDELLVPVVRDADELTLEGLARAIHDLVTRARERRLRPEDVRGGTFTLTNPGIFGGLGGTPLLNQPQVAILGLGAITKRPVVIDDAIAIRPMMMLSLTIDHRAADGMTAFRYLEAVRRRLGEEQP